MAKTKILDYKKIIKEAEEKEISPYLIIKRQLNYRGVESGFPRCRNCSHLLKIENAADGRSLQCDIIGFGYDEHSNVGLNYICNAYK